MMTELRSCIFRVVILNLTWKRTYLCCDSRSKASSDMKTATFVHGVARSLLHEVARSCPKLVARSCSTLLKPTRPSKLVARSCSKLVARSCTELPEVARSSQRWAGCHLCLTCRTQLQFESISGKHTEQFGNQARCQSQSGCNASNVRSGSV